MIINYWLGQAFEKFGYRILKQSKWHEANCNLIEIGFALLARSGTCDINVVQVGAFDGQMSDPLQKIVGYSKSRCLLVEPQPGPFQVLQKRYGGNPAVALENAAVTEQDGPVTMFIPSDQASPMASIDPNHYKKFGLKRDALRKISVPGLTPKTLVSKHHLAVIDVLQIDTEGYDARLVSMFVNAGFKPSIINFESLHCGDADLAMVRQLLETNGYWWIKGDQDTFAINEKLVHSAFNKS
jgi:FkbM family methyltransferase